MNSVLTFLLLVCYVHGTLGQAFITTWKTDNVGKSNSNQITIPTTGTGYNYGVYWEKVGNEAINGTLPGPLTGDTTITFPSAGIYRVFITGSFPRIYFNGGFENENVSDNLKILTVEQWGGIVWTSFAHAFQRCTALTIPAVDAPNLSQVSDFTYMFAGAHSLNHSLAHWDVSTVTTMNGMFRFTNFKQLGIGDWDVSNVTDMSWMFEFAQNFDEGIGNWDVSNVTNMRGMFSGARSFNQPIGNWNVSHVTDMGAMFSSGYLDWNPMGFNQYIGNWDVGNVKDMSWMFNDAILFDQPIGNWNVSSVTDMSGMFNNATSFNQSLDRWNISSVSTMVSMLSGSGLNVFNYDQTLIGWSAQDVKVSVPLGAHGLKYCSGEMARAELINSKGWSITGDTRNYLPPPVSLLTQPVCFGSTGSITVAMANNDDQYSFDNGLTFQTSNVKSGLAAGVYLVVVKSSLQCTSAPFGAIINPPYDKPDLPAIEGGSIVCPNVVGVDYVASPDEYTYQWFVDGGAMQSQEDGKIKVNWGSTNFNAWVKALGYDLHGCPTDTAVFQVKIQIKLKPILPQGIDSICYNFRAGVPYQTSSTNGSVYTWLTDGGTVSQGQTSASVKIDWEDIGSYKLWVIEENTTSTDYCEGSSDTLDIIVFKDLAAITMNFVSVDYLDEGKVSIQWEANLLERISDLIIISRRIANSNNPWEIVATLQKDVQSHLDQNVLSKENIYEYKIEGFNKCDEGLQTVIHNTIKLDGDKEEVNELINLYWNDYNGWDEVDRYEVWRRLDNDTTYRLIDITPGTITNYTGKHGADGFVHQLRIKAKKKGENMISWSNSVELNFENPIDFIPNILTPNGDGKNDTFFIPKLNLYTENYLGIYNRWGKLIYEKFNYKSEWNSEGSSEGIYYYILRLKKNNRELRGWVQVIR